MAAWLVPLYWPVLRVLKVEETTAAGAMAVAGDIAIPEAMGVGMGVEMERAVGGAKIVADGATALAPLVQATQKERGPAVGVAALLRARPRRLVSRIALALRRRSCEVAT